MVTIEMSSLSENHLLAAILANVRMITAVYLEKGNLLSAHQFGFRTGLGAADLLIALNHEWLTAINGGGAVRALAVDIAGAFDI